VSNLFARYKTSRSAENEGVWLNFGGGTRVKTRSTSSPKVREYQSRLFKKFRQALSAGGGVLPPEMQDEMDIDLVASVVIADWEGVPNANGVIVPYARPTAMAILAELPEWRKEIQYLAGLAETYREAGFEEQLGNSKESSVPASATAETPSDSSQAS